MTTSAIRTKVHKYIDEADSNVLEVVYKLLEVYRQSNSSLLTEEQQKEVIKRSAQYKAPLRWICNPAALNLFTIKHQHHFLFRCIIL